MAVLIVAVIALLLFPEHFVELSILTLLIALAYGVFTWHGTVLWKTATLNILEGEKKA